MSQQPEGITIDWSTAPAQMREAFEANAKRVKELEKEHEASAARIAVIDRRERIESLKAQLGDSAKDVSPEDFGDTPAEQITDSLVRAKAIEKETIREAALAKLAKDAGFESGEALQAFMAERETAKAAATKAQGAAASVAGAGGAPPEAPAPPSEQAFKAFREAKDKGLPNDEAQAAYVGATIEALLAAHTDRS
jgi:hypothetical protein